MTGGDEAADRIEELLIAGAREWMTTAAEPAGGVRWIASALRRLPRAAATSPAGAALGAAAATHLGRTPELDRLPADAYDNWFPWLLARLKTASLRVALIDGGVEFEGEYRRDLRRAGHRPGPAHPRLGHRDARHHRPPRRAHHRRDRRRRG